MIFSGFGQKNRANRLARNIRHPRGDRLLEAGAIRLPVKIVENSRATRLTLRIVPGGKSVRLTIPPHVSDIQVDAFLDRNRGWVEARIAKLPDSVTLSNGALIRFLGVEHRLEFVDRLRGVVEPVLVNGYPVLRVPGDGPARARKLLAFMKKEARNRLDKAVSRHAAAINVRPRAIRITDTTSRWGSCSSTRTLSFSWRIVMAPPEVLDYLAAHEVAHLREMNHSRAFWELVRSLCPQMDRHKAWLRTHGATLHSVTLP
jgi:predicted metal-dependent hydrolase